MDLYFLFGLGPSKDLPKVSIKHCRIKTLEYDVVRFSYSLSFVNPSLTTSIKTPKPSSLSLL